MRKVYDMFIGEVIQQKAVPSQKHGENSDRILGTYEGQAVILKVGKFGPYLSHGEKNISLKYHLQQHQKSHQDLTLEEVVDTLRYPIHIGNVRVKGNTEALHIHRGPYGIYLKFMNKNFKIPQQKEPTFKECIRYIREQTR